MAGGLGLGGSFQAVSHRAALAALLALAGCSASAYPPQARAEPHSSPAACAWYSPVGRDGQQVIITATGTPCGASPVIGRIAVMTGRTWISTAYLPASTCIAQVGRGRAVVLVWEAGFSRATMDAAGGLADDLQAAGWRVLVPGPGCTTGATPRPTSAPGHE